jgi:hypothetical protein|tara:strand:- start:645 stop:1640 length:996 start_codon:yes stop_codon:yes gene_type:complete
MSLEQTLFKRIFRDVVRGHSISYYQKNRIYIRHLGVNEQVDLDDFRLEHLEKAKRRGIPTEEEILDLLNEQKDWTEKDEKEIATQKEFIESLIENKAGLYLQSQLNKQDEVIEQAREKLNKQLVQRKSLLGNTCEEYAEKRCIDLYIIKSFYKDLTWQDPVFTQESFDELSASELHVVSRIYNEIFTVYSDLNFQKLILEDFYSPYMQCCDKPIDFFGKATTLLSHYQLRLYSYTTLFKSIFQNSEEIPFAIKKDPQKLMDWARNPKGREKAREVMEKAGDGGAGLFGATKEDLENLGVETSGAGTVSLEEAAKKKGGSLTMKDLMKLSGV